MKKTRKNIEERRLCMEQGALWPFVQMFADHLYRLGYTLRTTKGYLDVASHFADWTSLSNIALSEVHGDIIERFVHHKCLCPSSSRQPKLPSKKYISRTIKFLRFLSERGVIPETPDVVGQDLDARVKDFKNWLRVHRGLSEHTIAYHVKMVRKLLPALGNDPEMYNADLIRRVVFDESKRSSHSYMRFITTSLRSYLRFLSAHGVCRPWLYDAVPTIMQWSLSTLPRYLPEADVERLIASCDLTKPQGVRDKAILLLLARLGLRGGDVQSMCLDDIEWQTGTLLVRGKGRREVRLPLPQDVGDAILSYLVGVRPRQDFNQVFLLSCAPFRPFKGPSNISVVVKYALKRAGITDAPSQGANLLRHSAATSMLRAGATLDAIGTVLRHRSVHTTAHYAKVDIPMLRQIAQPWPGGVPC